MNRNVFWPEDGETVVFAWLLQYHLTSLISYWSRAMHTFDESPTFSIVPVINVGADNIDNPASGKHHCHQMVYIYLHS